MHTPGQNFSSSTATTSLSPRDSNKKGNTMIERFLRSLPFWKSSPSRTLIIGFTLGFSVSLSLTGLALYSLDAWKRSVRKKEEKRIVEIRENEVADGVEGLIGNTPLVRIKSLSDMTGVEILGKCEFLNPFGSVKDRVSLKIIKEAEEQDLIHPDTNSCVFEGTSGSTGISISGIARSRGYKAHIVLSDDVAREKVQLLEAYGAEVERVRPVSIVDKRHYVNLARKRAADFGTSTIISTTSTTPDTSTPGTPTTSSGPSLLISSKTPSTSIAFSDPPRGLFADQFENLSNLSAHYESTGPEIWRQVSGNIDAFVSGAGTGGTIAGVGKYLKECNKEIEIVLADPQGSGLYHKIHDGVMYSQTEAEGKRRRYQVDTVVEGIGLNRITKNLSQALPFIDDAYQVTDEEAVAMSRHLSTVDGLFLGSSSAVNLVTCVRLAKKLGKDSGKTIVTILCDSGQRHLSRFWNDEYLAGQHIPVSSDISTIWGEGRLEESEEKVREEPPTETESQ